MQYIEINWAGFFLDSEQIYISVCENLGCDLPLIPRVGIYIHIPFCTSICNYCDFVKTSSFNKKQLEVYIKLLFENIKNLLTTYYKDKFHTKAAATLYFGGGSPDIFYGDIYANIIDYFSLLFEIIECTIECNPLHLSKKRYDSYIKCGINRVTIGAQSLCPKVLHALKRHHTPKLIMQNIEIARDVGFKNIQVDLIYGLNLAYRSTTLNYEIKTLVSAGATGISTYSLTKEPRTEASNLDLFSEQQSVGEYVDILNTCAEINMLQIEVSNFSYNLPLHNLIYWCGLPYLGAGTAAHGLTPKTTDALFGQRYQIGYLPQELRAGNDNLDFINNGSELFKVLMQTPRTKVERIEELIYTLLRLPTGIRWDYFSEFFGESLFFAINKDLKIQRAINEGRISISENNIKLLNKEFLFADYWADHMIFIADRELQKL